MQLDTGEKSLFIFHFSKIKVYQLQKQQGIIWYILIPGSYEIAESFFSNETELLTETASYNLCVTWELYLISEIWLQICPSLFLFIYLFVLSLVL
jgi:hypothetical protein